jgi:hypothetical protein
MEKQVLDVWQTDFTYLRVIGTDLFAAHRAPQTQGKIERCHQMDRAVSLR